MKAVVYTHYGPPEVLQIKEVEKPKPKKNEVLVRVHATTVNRTDTGFRDVEYFAVRVAGGFFKPRHQILGSEFSGVIESVGEEVKNFKSGDEVFGLKTYQFGAHAEYICVSENGSIALKPNNFSFEEAAAVCDGLMLAINYIRNMDFSKSPKVLINGASGSIGSAAVQLAKYYGAQVTAVCGTKNLDLIKSLGADFVIDYMTTDFTLTDKQFDYVLDSVGKSSFGRCKKILKQGGVYFSSELGSYWQNVWLPLFNPLLGGKKVKFPIPTDNQKDIIFFKQLIEDGHYKAVIDRIYTFDQIIEATKYVETHQKTGNVVVRVI